MAAWQYQKQKASLRIIALARHGALGAHRRCRRGSIAPRGSRIDGGISRTKAAACRAINRRMRRRGVTRRGVVELRQLAAALNSVRWHQRRSAIMVGGVNQRNE
jgi:hypothetical protein